MKMKGLLVILCAITMVTSLSMFALSQVVVNVDETPTIDVNVNIAVERNGDIIYSESVHNLIADTGEEYVEQALTNSTYVSVEGIPEFISLSTSSSALDGAWTQIPDEITTGGLARAQGTITDLGNGTWKVVHEFQASATHTDVQTSGLNWKTGDTDNCLFAANNFTVVSLISGDNITVTWTQIVS